VVPTLQSIAAFGSDGRQLSTTAITVGGSSSVVTLTGLDQFRVALAEQPSFTWSDSDNAIWRYSLIQQHRKQPYDYVQQSWQLHAQSER
jgi:hypothetical protein